MFKEGDLVEYNKTLYFVITNIDEYHCAICPVSKIDLFGTDKERLVSIVKHSFTVYKENLKLNESGRLENENG